MIRPDARHKPRLHATTARLLVALEEEPHATTAELAWVLGLTRSATEKRLYKLARRGWVVQHGRGQAATWTLHPGAATMSRALAILLALPAEPGAARHAGEVGATVGVTPKAAAVWLFTLLRWGLADRARARVGGGRLRWAWRRVSPWGWQKGSPANVNPYCRKGNPAGRSAPPRAPTLPRPRTPQSATPRRAGLATAPEEAAP